MSAKKSLILAGAIVLISVLSLLLTHTVGTTKQEVRKNAAETNQDTTVFNLRVLVVAINPVENGQNLVDKYYAPRLRGLNADQAENASAQKMINAFYQLSGGTINYSVVKKIQVTSFPTYTNGFQYNFASFEPCVNGDPGGNCERQKAYVDYPKFITDNRICEIAEENNVDEIWMYSLPFVMRWENIMIGPGSDGFDINGGVYGNLAQCKKYYAVMGPTYNLLSFVHIYGHRVEHVMNILASKWSSEAKQQHWERFARIGLYGEPIGQETGPYSPTYCGNAHFASNSIKHYDYTNTTSRESICSDWKNFPNYLNSKETPNCNSWNCGDEINSGWGEYWLGSLPRGRGIAMVQGGGGNQIPIEKNWWRYILFPQRIIDYKKDLYIPPSCDAQCGMCGWRDEVGNCFQTNMPDGSSCCHYGCSSSNACTNLSGQGQDDDVCLTDAGERRSPGSPCSVTSTPTPLPSLCPSPPAVIQQGPSGCIITRRPSFLILDQGNICLPHDVSVGIRKNLNNDQVIDSGEDCVTNGCNWIENGFDANQEYNLTISPDLPDGSYMWKGWSRTNPDHVRSAPNNFVFFNVCANNGYVCSGGSCLQGANSSITFKIRFQGINSPFPSGISREVSVSVRQGGDEKYFFGDVNVVSDSNGFFSGRVAEIDPGTYDIYIKGWSHLAKKFASIALAPGENNINIASVALEAGDFSCEGYNILNINDLSAILSAYTSLSVPVNDNNREFDLDCDGSIDINDVSLVLSNYTQLEEWGD